MRKLRQVVGLSKILSAMFLPLCVWGLLASLVLFLVDVRGAFLVGGANNLRVALVAFAGGLVLVQRLRIHAGKLKAQMYGFFLLGAMSLFALWHAVTFQFGTEPMIIFAVNEALFILLMWSGIKVTAACAVDTPENVIAVGSSGAFSRRQKKMEKQKEKSKGTGGYESKWKTPLPKRHPARSLLYFALFTLPIFAVGAYLLNAQDATARFRSGVYLFFHFLFFFTLLALSGLRQLTAYFKNRNVDMPENIALPWLAGSVMIALLAPLIALFLPQPPSPEMLFIRDRIVCVVRPVAPKPPEPGEMGDSGYPLRVDDRIDNYVRRKYVPVDRLGDAYISEMARSTGVEREYMAFLKFTKSNNSGAVKFMDWTLKLILFVLFPICGLVILYAVICAFIPGARGFAKKLTFWRRKESKEKKKSVIEKKKGKIAVPRRRFKEFVASFDSVFSGQDTAELARHCWEGVLALCAEKGAGSGEDQTPFEFLHSKPEPLEGTEDEARFIAETHLFCEYSGQEPEVSANARLRECWYALTRKTA